MTPDQQPNRITKVRCCVVGGGPAGIESDLTIACDGRHSTVRERAGLAVEEIGAPMDVLWFRAGRKPDETENLFTRVEHELDAVSRRREFPVKMTPRMQMVVQNHVISGALRSGNQPLKVPLIGRLVTALPWLQGIPARLLALGVRPEHVHSRAAPTLQSATDR